MSKPPASAPHSDIDGVHQDGTRPSKRLPAGGEGAAGLKRAADEDAARPPYTDEESHDERTG